MEILRNFMVMCDTFNVIVRNLQIQEEIIN
jgi:hypothetical protein